MKNLFALLSFFILPFMAFWDLLPEPETLISDENLIIDEDTTDIKVIEESDLNNTAINEADVLNENEEEFDPLRRIYFWFCDQWLEDSTRSYEWAWEQWKPFKMCALFYNYSDRDITLKVDLTNAAIDDTDWMDICTLDFSFWNFLTSWELWTFTIPADNYVIKEFEITLPIWFEWKQVGCLSYRAIDENEGESEWLIFTVRKWFFMHFFVWSLDWIKNELTIDELTKKFNDNWDLMLTFFVENIGNMENKFDIQWTIKWFFWYNKKFESSDTIQLAPNKRHYIELNLWSLPSYGWKYNIDFTINGTPYFSYDISNANVDPARLEPKSWTFGTTYFKMPWLILAVVVIFILLLIVLFKKPKQKVVYVQQQPQQPIQPQQVQQQPTQQYTQPVQQPIQQPQQPVQPVQQPQQPQNPNYPQN